MDSFALAPGFILLASIALAAAQSAGPPGRDDIPQPPYTYRDEEVTVESVDGVTLAGTLTLPDGSEKCTGVVLVSGSGPHNRDEEMVGHRPFLVIADFLARRGIAVLRYDDRGVAGSTGDYDTATTADFVVDARAAAEHLAARPEVSNVVVVGHSEGGVIAPQVAGASEAVDAVVLLAGPATPLREVIQGQLQDRFGASEASPPARAAIERAAARMIEEAVAGDAADAASRAAAAFREELAGVGADARKALGSEEDSIALFAGLLARPWERYALTYDPAPALRALGVPVLAIFAGLDQQVRPESNVPAAMNALRDAPRGSVVLVLTGHNHLFQPTTTGSPDEYSQINTSFAPAMMALVANWITGRPWEEPR